MGEDLREELLNAWIGLNGYLKDSRVTQTLTYNESVTMKLVLDQYRQDGIGKTPVQTILRKTHMLKSQVNRTVNSLCQQGYLRKEKGDTDARALFVCPVPERLTDFLTVHEHSLQMAQTVIDVIGAEDAAQFVRICQRLLAAEPKLL